MTEQPFETETEESARLAALPDDGDLRQGALRNAAPLPVTIDEPLGQVLRLPDELSTEGALVVLPLRKHPSTNGVTPRRRDGDYLCAVVASADPKYTSQRLLEMPTEILRRSSLFTIEL